MLSWNLSKVSINFKQRKLASLVSLLCLKFKSSKHAKMSANRKILTTNFILRHWRRGKNKLWCFKRTSFCRSFIFWQGTPGPIQVAHITVLHVTGRLLALLANIKPAWKKNFSETNTLAYFAPRRRQNFYNFDIRAQCYKTYLSVNYGFS